MLIAVWLKKRFTHRESGPARPTQAVDRDRLGVLWRLLRPGRDALRVYPKRRRAGLAAALQNGGAGAALAALGILLGLNPSASAQVSTVSNKWAVLIKYPCDSSPAIDSEGNIFFGTWDGKLWALKSDGSRKWIFSTGHEIKSAPALGGDGTVYFGCRDRKVYAVGPDGKKKWDFKTGAWVDSSPAIGADGTIYVGSWDKTFYALNPDGSKKWQFPTAGEIVSSPAIGAAGRIYFGSHDRNFYALAPDGAKAWAFATGGPIISSPAIDRDGTVYFTSVDGFFYALDPDGQLKWRLKTGGITESSPVIGQDGMLYVGVNQQLWALTREPKKKWQYGLGVAWWDPVEVAPLALADGSVCFISHYGLLTNLDADGKWKWHYYMYGNGTVSPAVAPSGSIYTAGQYPTNGICFQALRTDAPLAQSPWPKFRGNPENTGRAAPAELQSVR
ncbi:MAG TPA: PQQ-binding-like beta-propeller repeat protein [Verrucomicrobiae bacterium]|nr:PQQ-binding-like beta-propeller repeat protein [Verrucomicrobiae bacterium]